MMGALGNCASDTAVSFYVHIKNPPENVNFIPFGDTDIFAQTNAFYTFSGQKNFFRKKTKKKS